MSTNKEWLSALNLLIFFEKGLWQVGQMTSGPDFFFQNSKNYGNYPKISFFSKNILEFAAVKKKQVL